MMEQCKENETMRNYKITVAGTGYVGLSIATLLSQHHQVTAVDIVPEKVELINNRKSPIQDDYIEEYLAQKELNLTATLDAKTAYTDADFVVIAAPTNYDRASDITLSDCWGYANIAPEMTDNNGLSCIVCHSPKGKNLYNEIIKDVNWKKMSFDDLIKYNSNYNKSAPMGERRESFWDEYNVLDKKELFIKIFNLRHMEFPKAEYLLIQKY